MIFCYGREDAMNNEEKTKEQLLEEIEMLNHRVKDLELSEAEKRQLRENQSFRIGSILIEMGYLTQLQLDRALQKQHEINKSSKDYKTLGDVMVESGIITSEELHEGLAEQLKRLNNLITLYVDEKLLLDSINTIHSHGFSAKSSDSEEVKEIFNKWKESETQRKIAEKALRDMEEKYRILVENTSEAIAVVQGEHFTFVNRHCMQLTGYSEDELTAMQYVSFVHPGDAILLAEYFERRIKDKESQPIHSFRILDKAGNTKWVEINTVLVTWSGRPAVLSFMIDITEKKKMEEEILRIQKLESVGILAGGIAHDFNNILTAIFGNISMARNFKKPEEILEKLDKIEKVSTQAKVLTQQLLVFAKGGKPIKTFVSIIETLRDSAIIAIRNSCVECKFSIADNLWSVEADLGQIEQVINNIVINAVQASPEKATVDVIAENINLKNANRFSLKAGPYIKISIIDRGEGIPEDNLNKIFYPYFTTKKDGNGLGLAIAYSVIKNHDGHITVESAPGVGTTFQIYLPASPNKSISIETKKSEDSITKGEGMIMVMDDTEIVRDVASDMLKCIGYEVVTATDGAEAIELYKKAMESEKSIDVIIMDLNIPGGMGGKEAIKRLKEVDPSVKAVVSSGYSNDSIMSEFKKYGFSGVIAKPYKAKELHDVLREVMANKA